MLKFDDAKVPEDATNPSEIVFCWPDEF